jgi:hypothetical protein
MDIYGISYSILVQLVSCIYTYPFIIIIYKLIYKRLGTVGLEKHPQLSFTHAAVF